MGEESFVARSAIRAIVRQELKTLMDSILAPGIGKAIGDVAREVEKRCGEKIAFNYRGHYADGTTYARGDVVSIPALGLYRAERETQSRPGSDGAGWSLLIKAGRDGRDGQPAPEQPPAQRTTRSVRSG